MKCRVIRSKIKELLQSDSSNKQIDEFIHFVESQINPWAEKSVIPPRPKKETPITEADASYLVSQINKALLKVD